MNTRLLRTKQELIGFLRGFGSENFDVSMCEGYARHRMLAPQIAMAVMTAADNSCGPCLGKSASSSSTNGWTAISRLPRAICLSTVAAAAVNGSAGLRIVVIETTIAAPCGSNRSGWRLKCGRSRRRPVVVGQRTMPKDIWREIVNRFIFRRWHRTLTS